MNVRSNQLAALVVVLALLAACSSTYKSAPRLTYYHGANVQEGYVDVIRASPAEIEFRIRIEFKWNQLYHLVLDGNDPVAQGWFRTTRVGGPFYTVVLKPDKGRTFEVGKTYRFCIGLESPQKVQMTSSNYNCLVDHEFVFEEKG